jgi:hypothetical protein
MPFTHDQFLDVFAEYNRALWPAVAFLWILTVWSIVRWLRGGPEQSRLLAAVLALHWAWSGLAYHLAFFRQINPVASMFAVLFVLQSAAFLWFGVVRRSLTWRFTRSARGIAGIALIVYGLLYPAIGLALGLQYPRMPFFGVPCPTTLVTAGVLLLAVPGSPRVVNWIPIAWCAVAASAALQLGIRADLALIVAGVLLLLDALFPARRTQPRAARV